MIRKYLFYEDINDGYIYFYVDKNEGINAEVFLSVFCRCRGIKNHPFVDFGYFMFGIWKNSKLQSCREFNFRQNGHKIRIFLITGLFSMNC